MIKRLYDREDIAEATVMNLAQMERRDLILAISEIQIGIQIIWHDYDMCKEVVDEIIMPLLCVFNEYHPYEEVSFTDTLKTIKAMNVTFDEEER